MDVSVFVRFCDRGRRWATRFTGKTCGCQSAFRSRVIQWQRCGGMGRPPRRCFRLLIALLLGQGNTATSAIIARARFEVHHTRWQGRRGLLSYFAPRPIETPFKCNFCTGVLTLLWHFTVSNDSAYQARAALAWFTVLANRKLRGTTPSLSLIHI